MKIYFKCRPARNASVGGYLAWAGFKPLIGDSAIKEQQEPVFFEFGQSESEAIARLKKGLDAPGVTEWERQSA